MFIPDPESESGSRIRILIFLSIPDPGSRGQKGTDPGSGSANCLCVLTNPGQTYPHSTRFKKKAKLFYLLSSRRGEEGGEANSTLVTDPVFRIRDIFVRIRILVSVPLHNGSGRPKNVRILRIRNTGRRRIYS
jgi:hypothetical protein